MVCKQKWPEKILDGNIKSQSCDFPAPSWPLWPIFQKWNIGSGSEDNGSDNFKQPAMDKESDDLNQLNEHVHLYCLKPLRFRAVCQHTTVRHVQSTHITKDLESVVWFMVYSWCSRNYFKIWHPFQRMFSIHLSLVYSYPISESGTDLTPEVQELEANQKMTKCLTLAKSSPDAK